MAGVITNFMAQNLKIKTILWDSSYSTAETVEMMMTYSKSLVRETDVATYMKEKGYVHNGAHFDGNKRTVWTKGKSVLTVKAARDWKEHNGPNNGFMRVFMHNVLTKLHEHNPIYGWDDSLVDALFDGEALYLINKPYSEQWRCADVERTTPRHWTIPQLHYLGLYAADIANKAQNMAIVEGQPDFAVPVDLDATWRGSPTTGSAFLKTLPMEIRIQKMEGNYAHIK